MRDPHNEPLNDALAREIEQALAVEPSPEFQARVRQRVAQEPPLAGGAFGWWRPALWPAAAVVTTVVVIVVGWQLGPADGIRDDRASVARPLFEQQPRSDGRVPSVAPSAGQMVEAHERLPATSARSAQPASATLEWLAPVIVADDEIAGMRALIADAQAGRFESVIVTEHPVLAVVAAPRQAADVSEGPSETTSASASDADGAELARTGAGQAPQGLSSQVASAVLVRPLVIEPLTIKPVVQSLPETPEGVGE